MDSKAEKNRDIYLIICNEDNECMDRELVAKTLPLEGGVFTAKGERGKGVSPVRQDVINYGKVFSREKSLEKEVAEFLERFRPYFQGLRELENKGYTVDFLLDPSGDDHLGVERKFELSKSLLQNMAETGLCFILYFGACIFERKKEKIKKYKLLNKFERCFLRKHMNVHYSTCLVKCFERGEDKSAYRHEFVYRGRKKKLQGLRYAVKQVDKRHKAGALKKPALLKMYCYHNGFRERLLLTPKFLRRLSDMKVDLEFNWYSGGFTRG